MRTTSVTAVNAMSLRKTLALLIAALFSTTTLSADDYTVELYDTYCQACHNSAGAGVPVAFNEQHWKKRIDQGMDTLVSSAINGKGNMPAQGLCQECTYQDFEALITYMSKAKVD